MDRRKYYSGLFKSTALGQLPKIKTMGELSEHIGEVLYFDGIKGYDADWICSWMGILDKKTFIKNGFEPSSSIARKDIYIKDSIFINRYNRFNNVFVPTKGYNSNKSLFSFNHNDFCNAQTRIIIPTPSMLFYYNFCKLYFASIATQSKIKHN